MEKEKDNPGFVTHAECANIVSQFNGELKTIKKALVGGDLRGGLVKDVAEIKQATSWVKTIVVPIATSVAAALITYIFLVAL